MASLNEKQLDLCTKSKWDFSDLRALFINCTLKPSPQLSHTQGLIDISKAILEKNGVSVDVLRAVDYDIAPGIWPDMTEHGWDKDDWPGIFGKVMAADILVITSPIWLGEKSSVCTKVIERLYSCSSQLNDSGQYAYYGRVGGCLITGNEDGAKHCSMNILYSLQHLGYVIPPQADAAWLGEAGPGPSYLDEVYDVEFATSCAVAERCRRRSGPWQSTFRVGCGLPLRLSQSRISLIMSSKTAKGPTGSSCYPVAPSRG